MYTDEANEIYLKVCEKYKREPLDTMHTRTMLFECINIALKQGKTLPIHDVSESKLKAKIEDVLNDISKMEKHGEWHGFMHDNENAGMITKLWSYCR